MTLDDVTWVGDVDSFDDEFLQVKLPDGRVLQRRYTSDDDGCSRCNYSALCEVLSCGCHGGHYWILTKPEYEDCEIL